MYIFPFHTDTNDTQMNGAMPGKVSPVFIMEEIKHESNRNRKTNR